MTKTWDDVEKEFDKEFDDFFLPCPDEVRNELKYFLHQIYSQAKEEQREEDAKIAEGKKVVGDFAPKETMKILGITQEDIQHELDIRNQACDSIASEIRGQH